MNKKKLIINHLYSQNLNLYGDLGNIIALKYRLEKRNLPFEIINTELYDEKIHKADIYFIGGGQDNDQMLVFKHLLKHKDFIAEEYNNGKVFLLICGGYQLFGKYFLDAKGRVIEGLDLINIETKALDSTVKSRCIGNILVELSKDFVDYWNIDLSFSKFIVGFENHGGQTYFIKHNTKIIRPIGKVIKGYGNNFFEKLEGAWCNNLIGTYLHGPILPKNPHLTDAIIKKALKISELKIFSEDIIEYKAHYQAMKLCFK